MHQYKYYTEIAKNSRKSGISLGKIFRCGQLAQISWCSSDFAQILAWNRQTVVEFFER